MLRRGAQQLLRLGDWAALAERRAAGAAAASRSSAAAAAPAAAVPAPAAAACPGYAIETLEAEARAETGSLAAARLRRAGRVPAVLFSLPGEGRRLLSLDAAAVGAQLARHGRSGWAARLFDVRVAPPAGADPSTPPTVYRALGRQAHLTSTTDAIENVTLLHAPPGRRVRAAVPLRAFGEEACPGLKAGGRLNWIARAAPVAADAAALPPAFEVDVSKLEIGQKVRFADLAVPPGVALAVRDAGAPVLKVMRR
jgi:large subunit ribosomal protein L25